MLALSPMICRVPLIVIAVSESALCQSAHNTWSSGLQMLSSENKYPRHFPFTINLSCLSDAAPLELNTKNAVWEGFGGGNVTDVGDGKWRGVGVGFYTKRLRIKLEPLRPCQQKRLHLPLRQTPSWTT